jgi:hypothetical protein
MMGKNIFAVRTFHFSLLFFLLTAPGFARQIGIPPLGRDFVITFIVTILFFIIFSIKTRRFIWPLWRGLRMQARWLFAAHIILILSCFLLCANIVIEKCHSFTGKIQTSSAVRADKKTGSASGATFVPAAIVKIEFIARKIALSLFVFGVLLLLPGIHAQKKMDPEKYLDRALRNSLRSMALGFLLIPGYIIVYYLTLALTAFIHD